MPVRSRIHSRPRATRIVLAAAVLVGLPALLPSTGTLSAQLCPPTVTPTGEFWASSSGSSTIYRFAGDGTPVDSFTLPGLSAPRSITMLPSGLLAVASQFSSTILVCDTSGSFSHSITLAGLNGPTGASMGPNGHYYVCSFNTDSVLEVDPVSETVVDTHTSTGLDGPNCIVFRPDGGFFVTGQISNDVHSFASDGNALGSFPTGQSSVMGAALDHQGRLLVAGGGSNDVRLFDCSGSVLDTWNVGGGPQSIAVRDDGTIFVTTFFSNEVRWYSEAGAFIAGWTGGNQIRGIEFLPGAPPSGTFIRGDANGDGLLNLADAIRTLGVLFTGDEPLDCEDAADTNDDGQLNIADPIQLLSYLFNGGSAPFAPFPVPGDDPTPDPLGC